MIGNELDSKVAGVIGMGRIGSIVARKLKGIGMKVIVIGSIHLSGEIREAGS
jgi:phosphoglycerate dehydrogenase-like enzyme